MKNKVTVITIVMILMLVFSVIVVAEEINLRVAWWGSQSRHDKTLEVIELFEEQNPDINIEAEFLGWDGYWEKMAAQASGKNLPDIWQQDYAYLSLYANRGLLLDLNPYVESGTLDFSNVEDTAISGGIINDGLYGINLGLNAPAVVYDPAVYEEAGMDNPDAEWTYQDYMDIAREITDKTGIYGTEDFPLIVDTQGFNIYLRQNGKQLYSDDGKSLGYEDDQLFVDYFNMALELREEGVIPSMDITEEISNVEEGLLPRGQAAMGGTWSNMLVAIDNAAGRPLNLTVPPKLEDQVQEGLYLKPSMFFSITEDTEHPEEAVKFVDFFTNNIEANRILMADRGVPISTEIREDLFERVDGNVREMFDYIDLAEKHSSKISPPEPDGHNQLLDLYNELHEMMAYDVITPEEAAREFRSKAEEVLQ